MSQRGIHVFGASGAGVSTLGWHLAQHLGVPYLDADSYYWLPTDPPFRQKVPEAERVRRIIERIDPLPGWVLGGSLCGWGDALIPRFGLVVFVYAPAAERLQRLRARERARYGNRIERGGDMHEQHEAFLEWAAAYDDGPATMRSLARHRQWARTLACPLVRLTKPEPVENQVATVRRELGRLRG